MYILLLTQGRNFSDEKSKIEHDSTKSYQLPSPNTVVNLTIFSHQLSRNKEKSQNSQQMFCFTTILFAAAAIFSSSSVVVTAQVFTDAACNQAAIAYSQCVGTSIDSGASAIDAQSANCTSCSNDYESKLNDTSSCEEVNAAYCTSAELCYGSCFPGSTSGCGKQTLAYFTCLGQLTGGTIYNNCNINCDSSSTTGGGGAGAGAGGGGGLRSGAFGTSLGASITTAGAALVSGWIAFY
jgi:hypothetical protein